MFVKIDDQIINLEHVATVRLYPGSNTMDFYGVSVYGGDHLLANYKPPKGYTLDEVMKIITDGIMQFNKIVTLPTKKKE